MSEAVFGAECPLRRRRTNRASVLSRRVVGRVVQASITIERVVASGCFLGQFVASHSDVLATPIQRRVGDDHAAAFPHRRRHGRRDSE
mgnify:FL=1